MKCTGLTIGLAAGLAAGAVTAMLLPRDCTARRMVQRAADAVEDAAMTVGEKISDKLDM